MGMLTIIYTQLQSLLMRTRLLASNMAAGGGSVAAALQRRYAHRLGAAAARMMDGCVADAAKQLTIMARLTDLFVIFFTSQCNHCSHPDMCKECGEGWDGEMEEKHLGDGHRPINHRARWERRDDFGWMR